MSVDQRDMGNPGALVARGIVGGIVAGALFLAVTMWFASSLGDPAKAPLLMMSTIVKGDEAMMAGTASVGVGLAVHAVLSAGFGVLFAALVSRLRSPRTVAAAGVVYGAALYVVNFKVLSPALFTTFEMANQPFELVVHVLFGALLALAFLVPARGPAAPRAEGPSRPARAPASA